MQASIESTLLLGMILLLSGAVVLTTLRKFRMKTAFVLFLVLLFVVGLYIPFFCFGKLFVSAAAHQFTGSFGEYFILHQLETINAPFFLFQSMSLFCGLLSLISCCAVAIATVFVVRIVVRIIKKALNLRGRLVHAKHPRVSCNIYIPNHHNIYLVLRRLRD